MFEHSTQLSRACLPVQTARSHPAPFVFRINTLFCPKRHYRLHIRGTERLVRRASWNHAPQPTTAFLDTKAPRNAQLESVSLDPEVRRRAEDAILQRGGRVTVGDAAATGSLSLAQAESALKALAADSLATLQVSGQGDIVYVFPTDFRSKIQSKSLRLRLEPVLNSIASTSSYLARVTFGTALVVSFMTVSIAIAVILSSARDERSGNRNSGGGGGGYSYSAGPRIWVNLSDILFYWDPFYHQRRAQLRERQHHNEMSFLEAIFSFVFGDGNPNANYERYRWNKLGKYIQWRGGVVTAEEMAPFLDVTPEQIEEERRTGAIVDESFVLPALTRLGGDPEVDAEGNIVYRFSSLQTTARADSSSKYPGGAAYERQWALTEASKGQQLAVAALGAANILGVWKLGSLLTNPANVLPLIRSGMGWVINTMPAFQLYAALFFIIPAVRWLINTQRNGAIAARNEARSEALEAVQQPPPALKKKLAAAQQQAQRRVIRDRDIVYRSDKAVEEQPTDAEVAAWDRKFSEKQNQR